MFVLRRIFDEVVQKGSLRVIEPDGQTREYGDGGKPRVVVKLTDRASAMKLIFDPDRYLGEVYMDGGLIVEHGDIYDFLAVLLRNVKGRKPPLCVSLPFAFRRWLRRLSQYNPIDRARANVAHHYDLSGALYDLFLDRDRQYSCAYFETANQSLDQAQLAKKRHLAAKLMIKPGMKVLDIGSGWGGLGLYLAEVCGAEVTGVTLSAEQFKLSNARAHQRGIADRVTFLLKDYRQLEGPFDRIVSVGMFEHVGINHYDEYFTKVGALLKPDGIAVIHSINRSDGPGATSAWIKRYIFPGGYIPALSEVLPAVERCGLYLSDVEILRLHYAETLRHWRRHFADHRDKARKLYDERFCRMWEFYLAASETAFRYQGMNNFQIQILRDQHTAPLTRDYMAEEEERLRRIDTRQRRLKSVPAG